MVPPPDLRSNVGACSTSKPPTGASQFALWGSFISAALKGPVTASEWSPGAGRGTRYRTGAPGPAAGGGRRHGAGASQEPHALNHPPAAISRPVTHWTLQGLLTYARSPHIERHPAREYADETHCTRTRRTDILKRGGLGLVPTRNALYVRAELER